MCLCLDLSQSGGIVTRKPLPFFFALFILSALLAGCSSNSTSTGTCPCPSSGVCDCPASPQGTVYMTMTDDPPAGVTILSFQVTLANATLMSSSGPPGVSLLNNIDMATDTTPPQIDVTQLQALSTFLSSAQVAPGTYTNLSLTFTNPQLVIYNQSDSALGTSCAVGSVCELGPASSTTLGFGSAPFPVTVSTSSALGFAIDINLNAVIQPDFSLNLAAANGVTISELSSPPAAPQFGSITGTVRTVTPSTDVFTLTAPWGGSFNIATTTSTAFNNFPSSACTTPAIGCLADGQIVTVAVSSMTATGYGGVLTATSVDYVQAATAQTVEGTIIQSGPSASTLSPTPWQLTLILHANPAGTTGFPLGGVATVLVQGGATYSIDSNGFTIPSGLTFTSSSDLAVGQNVTVTVEPSTVSVTGTGPGSGSATWGPPPSVSFSASAVELEPTQLTGTITGTASGTTSFTLGATGTFFAPWPMPSAVSSYDVDTTGQTAFTGFTPDTFSGVASNDFVSVSGWLFPPASGGSTPTIAAQSVVLRPTQTY